MAYVFIVTEETEFEGPLILSVYRSLADAQNAYAGDWRPFFDRPDVWTNDGSIMINRFELQPTTKD